MKNKTVYRWICIKSIYIQFLNIKGAINASKYLKGYVTIWKNI